MNFTCYVNRIKPKAEVVVTFQEIRKIKYSVDATASFYRICYVGVVLIWLMEYQCVIACGYHL